VKVETRKALAQLKRIGVFRADDAKRAGLPRSTLHTLVASGAIERVGRGLYVHPKSSLNSTKLDFATACAKFGPQSIIGGLTALFHYNLIEQVPTTIWLLVPYEQKTKETRLYRCLRTKLPPNIGVVDHGHYRIASVERAILESFRYATKIGLRTAVHAAKTAMKDKRTTEVKILRMARELGLERYLRRYWEAVIA
jgi:predicted transcriptional regulator of viral defense system